jgi:hypothetical protein
VFDGEERSDSPSSEMLLMGTTWLDQISNQTDVLR